MTCAHLPIAFHYDILRLSAEKDGPAVEFVLEGNAICVECRHEFRIFRVKLEPVVVAGSQALAHPCTHTTFETTIAVDRERHNRFETDHIAAAKVACYDCGMRFKPVRFRLESLDEMKPLHLPSDEEIERIGRSVH